MPSYDEKRDHRLIRFRLSVRRLVDSVVICVMAEDSTTVYYRVHRGIKAPPKDIIMKGGDDEDDE